MIKTWTVVSSVFCLALLCGCGVQQLRDDSAPEASYRLIAKDHRFAIVLPGDEDTLASLAQRFLGDEHRAWVIADFNRISRLAPGREVVIPLFQYNPLGVHQDGYQKVAIVSYHRIDQRDLKLSVAPAHFERQMKFLRDNDFRVIPLRQLMAFLDGRRPLPQRAVVITFDDGYRSAYQSAYPVLKKYGYPATIFVYTDFVGAPDALTWPQIREMRDSGLIDIQAHSRFHSNLALRRPAESEQGYHARVDLEVGDSIEVIRRQLNTAVYGFAYPYGDANEQVIDTLKAHRVRLGLTVTAGGAAFYSDPLMLPRTMIFGHDDLDDFRRKLNVFEHAALP